MFLQLLAAQILFGVLVIASKTLIVRCKKCKETVNNFDLKVFIYVKPIFVICYASHAVAIENLRKGLFVRTNFILTYFTL